VLLANREEVLAQSRHFQQALQQLEQAMLADDDQALQALLTRASDARLHWTMGQPRRPARRPDCIFDNSSCMYRTAFLDLPALATAGGTVSLPGSKSISNRVLLLAALSQGTTTIHDLLDSDDTRVMLAGLKQLGCASPRRRHTRPADCRHRHRRPAARRHGGHLFLGNAGTAMRPLTAALAVLGGDFEMTGVPRMHERPIGDLVDALRQLGCQIDYLKDEGFPPLKIGQPDFSAGDAPIQVRGDVSSQFLTALLMALPLLARTRPSPSRWWAS
jgi:3-phosphoshikimate 1-carboxyvinyltransferase